MKILSFLLMYTLFFAGCSYKNKAINLQNYKTNYSGPLVKYAKSVDLLSVKDIRKDKKSIGYILYDGDKTLSLHSSVDFSKKYKDGLQKALKSAGYDVSSDKAPMKMKVYIRNIELVKKDKSFNENLNGKILITVVITKGRKTIKQNFKQEKSKWIKPIYNSQELEPFLYELFSDSINTIVGRLTNY